MSHHCLLASTVSAKSGIGLGGTPPRNEPFLSCCFQILPCAFVLFDVFPAMCLLWACVFPAYRSLSSWDAYRLSSNLGCCFQPLVLPKLFCSLPSSSSGTPITCTFTHNGAYFSDTLFFFIHFVFCPLGWKVSINLTSTSLILSYVLVPLVNFSFQ